jgi:hypothetical protein
MQDGGGRGGEKCDRDGGDEKTAMKRSIGSVAEAGTRRWGDDGGAK